MSNHRFEKGDRFLDLDKRRDGRVIEVDQVGQKINVHTNEFEPAYKVRTEVHPYNPSAIGKSRWITERTLEGYYRKISQ